MPAGYLLDADVFRLYVTGDPKVVQSVAARLDSIRLSSITVMEACVNRRAATER